MKNIRKFGFATIIAGGLAAGALGFSGAAQADVNHHAFIDDITPTVNVPARRQHGAPKPLTSTNKKGASALRVPPSS